ncbi:MAG TPA: hypothetical protein VKR31_10255 [Rhizomicrobium sp.]|nr:hypothetical protein [Rhizomicrobium sp.]
MNKVVAILKRERAQLQKVLEARERVHKIPITQAERAKLAEIDCILSEMEDSNVAGMAEFC